MANPLVLEQSRAIPVTVEDAFARTLPLPLPDLFCHRYGPLPAIKEVTGQVGDWGRAGETRTIVLADGGTMREQLLTVGPPHEFTYRLTDITGMLASLATQVEGRWAFAPAGTGTLVTWTWSVQPRTSASSLALPVLGRFWKGYARVALQELSDQLLR